MVSTAVIIKATELGLTVSEVETPNGLNTITFGNLFTLIEKQDGSYHWGSNLTLLPEVLQVIPAEYASEDLLCSVLEYIHHETSSN